MHSTVCCVRAGADACSNLRDSCIGRSLASVLVVSADWLISVDDSVFRWPGRFELLNLREDERARNCFFHGCVCTECVRRIFAADLTRRHSCSRADAYGVSSFNVILAMNANNGISPEYAGAMCRTFGVKFETLQ